VSFATPAYADETLLKAEAGTLIWTEPLADGGRAVVKMYRRRGFLDPLRRLFVLRRAEREYRLLAHLHASGVACAEPLGWSYGTDRRHGHRERLVTREIPGAIALKELLRDDPSGAPDLTPLFALARRMHDAGIAHGAFYAANVLVAAATAAPVRFHVIDLAHGGRFGRGIAGTRPADYDVLDMLRSIARLMPIDDRERWVAGYGLDPGATARLLAKLARHWLERPWRHFRRAETDTREALDRLRPQARTGEPAA
jgi:tRNA A-37 threonylcarbamoyl transferase component Bud32